MKTIHDLGALEWTLSGWTPHLWRLFRTMELGASPMAEIPGFPASVPGSVQKALRTHGLLPDWNLPEVSRQCEWVENRQWVYETLVPDDWCPPGGIIRLRCEGLDYSGWIRWNGIDIGTFEGTHRVHVFDLAPHRVDTGNRLQVCFDVPPRWLGQFGETSKVVDFKTRFNYTWDWQPRLVQIGIWEPITLEVVEGPEFHAVDVVAGADVATGTGTLRVGGSVRAGAGASVSVVLADGDRVVCAEDLSAEEFTAAGFAWHGIPVDLWWPNGAGEQPLYSVSVVLQGVDGDEQDRVERTVGFRDIAWRACEGAPEGAEPWICVVNGVPTFLQGVNCPPLAPNYADLTPEHYAAQLATYRDLGVNTLRVNGVGYLEKEAFYAHCDAYGLLVWQDVHLSSSGVENVPPSDPRSILEVGEILRGFIARRRHHACLLLWNGGNELHERHPDGHGVPMTTGHPLIGHLDAIVRACDPGRRFLPTTATGPRFNADAKDFGKGIHHNVHGPWKLWGSMEAWREYWAGDDALFRAETGAPGAAPADLIRRWSGDHDPMPVAGTNPVWRRPVDWWVEGDAFRSEHGRDPETLEEYVAWSQARQAEALVIAVSATKHRFPRIGGILLWCGHDCHPCPANTSIIDFDGVPKPAARALEPIWKGPAGTPCKPA
ncbi:MAG: glycosyl hydrolase 2 galactose-binding domain-containing protein [Armatimonadota bacterium]